MKRFLPNIVLPKNYNFQTKHSPESFLTYTTYDFGSAAFTRTIGVPHNYNGVPLCDMWVSIVPSVTGNAVADKPARFDSIYATPTRLYTGTSPVFVLEDTYSVSADQTYIRISINHSNASSGIKHVYFHVKVYDDSFLTTLYNEAVELL